ncbi:MAG: hypothetical protein E6I40_00020 [Chloroflexi bacterium]|nr:MAG: hypothetical protein E6I40_00020 [Chloroflexota bacterium]
MRRNSSTAWTLIFDSPENDVRETITTVRPRKSESARVFPVNSRQRKSTPSPLRKEPFSTVPISARSTGGSRGIWKIPASATARPLAASITVRSPIGSRRPTTTGSEIPTSERKTGGPKSRPAGGRTRTVTATVRASSTVELPASLSSSPTTTCTTILRGSPVRWNVSSGALRVGARPPPAARAAPTPTTSAAATRSQRIRGVIGPR